MRILEVSPEQLDFVAAICLDPSIPPKWRQAMQPAMVVRKEWLKTMMDRGLQVSVAVEDSRKIINSLGPKNAKFKEMSLRGYFPEALIEYVPIEFASEPVKGRRSLFINCMWVVPPFWHKGLARALLERVVEKARVHGGASVLAYDGDKWFGFFPYMPVSFFEKLGFKEVDRDGSRVLLHLNLGADEKPTLIRPKTRLVSKSGRIVVDVLFNSQCPWSGWMAERIKQKMKKYNAAVNVVNTDDRKVIEEYGVARGICINGVPVIKRLASWKEVEAIVKQARAH